MWVGVLLAQGELYVIMIVSTRQSQSEYHNKLGLVYFRNDPFRGQTDYMPMKLPIAVIVIHNKPVVFQQCYISHRVNYRLPSW